MSLRHRLSMGSALVAVATTFSTVSQAQQTAQIGLEEIVVTAQRRAEPLQSVPIAVSAFTAAELERRNVNTAIDLVQYVPNLIGNNNTGLGTANTYFIRGVGDTESLASKDPPVGTYLDDIFFARQSANNFAFFDVERIEVLRGPQGTLFGRNTTGGAINVLLKKPAAEMGGYGEVSYGSFDQIGARGSVDLPMSDKVLTKVSGYYLDDNGYVKNTTTGEKLNEEQNYGGRFAVRALPNDNLTWDGFGMYMAAAGTNLTNFLCDPANPTNCEGRFATTGLRKNATQGQYPTIVIAGDKSNFPLGNDTKSAVLGSNFQYETSAFTVNAITGYVDTRQEYNVDFFDGRAVPAFAFVADPGTGRPSGFNVANNITLAGPVRGLTTGGFTFLADTKTTQFTQEVKVTGEAFEIFKYVAGAYYFDEKSTSDFADISTNATTRAVTLLADRVLRNTTEAWAVYAQTDAAVTDAISVTAGVRYTDEKKGYRFADNRAICQTLPLSTACIDTRNFPSVDQDLNPATPPISIPLDQQVKIWTPRFAINYTPSDDILLFASATRGFKSGGQSARATQVRLLLPFDPEKVWSYEAGIKSEWLDRRLRLNVTAFQADTVDIQGGSAFITTNPVTGAQALNFVTRNFAGFDNQGVEIEAQAVPLEGLTLTFAAGLQDAKYKIDRSAPALDSRGVLSVAAQQAECQAALTASASPRGDTRTSIARAQSACGNGIVTPTGQIADPVRAPKATISGGVSYDYPVAAWNASVVPSVNVVYTSKQQVGAANVSFYSNAAGVLNVVGDGTFITGAESRKHTLVNASIALTADDKSWTGVLECSNCFDVTYPQSAASNLNYFNAPRTWQIKIRRSF
jgi:iron complex outermembrane recepter protein